LLSRPLNGQTQPGPSPVVSRSSQVVAQRLTEIADEASIMADVAQSTARRMKSIEERARSAARLALRTAGE